MSCFGFIITERLNETVLLAEENSDCLTIAVQMARQTGPAINLFAFQSVLCEPVFTADYGKVMTVKKGERLGEDKTANFCMFAECYSKMWLEI